MGVPQAHRLHRTEPGGIQPPGRQHLDGHTALVDRQLLRRVKCVQGRPLGAHQRLPERLVFRLVQRAVDVIPCAALLPVIPGGAEGAGHIHAVRRNDGGGSVIKAQAPTAQPGDVLRQRLGGQRSGGDDRHPVGGDRRHLSLPHRNERMGADRLRHPGGKRIPIHRQRPAGRHRAAPGNGHGQTTQPCHLLLQQSGGALQPLRLQRIGANQLGKQRLVMRRGILLRFHLPQGHRLARLRRRIGSLAACQPRPDHRDCHTDFRPFPYFS